MAEKGFPRARLHPEWREGSLSYSWVTDIDEFLDLQNWKQDHAAWLAGMNTFMEVDHLRPEQVVLAPKVEELFREQN